MDPNTFPTKGNLILAKNTLRLSRQGYELLDKKRNVLIREIMELNEKAGAIQADIDRVFREAYAALQHANITMGVTQVERMSFGVPREDNIRVASRSVMGVEIPIVRRDGASASDLHFGMGNTSAAMDTCRRSFNTVKELIIQLSMVENAAYRLAINIKKTQKRANALKNITIPRYEALVREIQDSLEEREREEFTRLKVIKRAKG